MSDDKTIFNGSEDEIPAKFDKGGYLQPDVVITSANPQYGRIVPWGEPTPEPEEKKPTLFGRLLGAAALLAVTGVFVAACIWLIAACIWLIAAMMANLPTR